MSLIDAENAVMGRMATEVAERLLSGEQIEIINAEKAIISGNKKQIMEKFQTKLNLSPKSNPLKGPKFSRMPDRIVRRAVRGMLPFKKARGRDAFKRLKVHIAVPKELEGQEAEKIKAAENKLSGKFMTVGELSKAFGVKV